MHRALASRWLRKTLRTAESNAGNELQLPLFLCPALCTRQFSSKPRQASSLCAKPRTWRRPHRCLHVDAAPTPSEPGRPIEPERPSEAERPIESGRPIIPDTPPTRKLPAQCTGCGAYSQISASDQPGYFDLGRKAVRLYVGIEQPRQRRVRKEEEVYRNTIRNLDPAVLERQGLDMEDIGPSLQLALEPEPDRRDVIPKVPLCDRCHTLLHHQTGESIFHPTMDAIRETIDESPYKYNHVYHILDAADFPMSMLPQINQLLDLMPLRTRNRRAPKDKFYHGRKTELSFIITRADLLAPTKPQVDKLVPYLREVLRDALGRNGEKYRLGNIRCVSARRSWWTKELKEEIWKRGGAGWMVGRVNVGKSQLFQSVFPKGRMDWAPTPHQITIDMYRKEDGTSPALQGPQTPEEKEEPDHSLIEKLQIDDPLKFDEGALLPPAPPESQYPEMPLVSDLPGTTASPIRVPFGNGRGELIDLPGVQRSELEKYVQEEHRPSLVLRSRKIPEQLVMKPGQSVLLGGFIRITPREPAPIVLSYAFTPLEAHLTGTEKAVSIQNQTGEFNVENIAVPGTGEKTKLAGSFELKWDVTRERTGPITSKQAANIKIERLPYRVLAADILIEGVGWVELVAQVRTRELYAPRPAEPKPEDEKTESGGAGDGADPWAKLEALAEEPGKLSRNKTEQEPTEPSSEPNWPVVDVFSPEGKFVGCRMPMNGWLLNKPRVNPASLKARPRKSMKGAKKLEKKRRREGEGAAASSPQASF